MPRTRPCPPLHRPQRPTARAIPRPGPQVSCIRQQSPDRTRLPYRPRPSPAVPTKSSHRPRDCGCHVHSPCPTREWNSPRPRSRSSCCSLDTPGPASSDEPRGKHGTRGSPTNHGEDVAIASAVSAGGRPLMAPAVSVRTVREPLTRRRLPRRGQRISMERRLGRAVSRGPRLWTRPTVEAGAKGRHERRCLRLCERWHPTVRCSRHRDCRFVPNASTRPERWHGRRRYGQVVAFGVPFVTFEDSVPHQAPPSPVRWNTLS